MDQIFNEEAFYQIGIKDKYRELFTTPYPIIGNIYGQTKDHIYIHCFKSDNKGVIHFGFAERIPRNMLSFVKELKEKL